MRYKNSLIGFLWGFLKPLLYLVPFTIIFKTSSGIPNYTLFALSGLILWVFFSNVTGQSVGSIVGSAGLLKSLNIPSYFFPLSETISELFNLLLTLIVFLVVMYWGGIAYSPRMLLIIPFIVVFATFSFGLNLFLCSINVFFRDVGIIWNTIQPALFFLTPIAYPEKNIDPKYRLFIEGNPIYYFIKLGRSIMYDAQPPTTHMWISCITISATTLFVGLLVFKSLKNQFISAI